MSLLLTCLIQIDTIKFRYAESVEIESSWREAEKCTLRIPRKALLKKNESTIEELDLEKTFKTGMPVSVALGYDGQNTELFSGYIAEIKPDTLLEIICEDEYYQLKRSKRISKSYTGTLKGLLQSYFPQAEIDEKLPDVKLVNFIMKEVTQAEILKQLKESYGFCAYFRAKKLYVGLPYFEGVANKKHKFDFQKNVVSAELAYKKEEDIRVKCTVISFLSNNTKIEEKDIGDKEGEQKTFFLYGESDKAKLKAFGENELKKLKFEGYRGSLTAFGLPVVKHQDTVLLYDKRYTERSGQGYLVDKVKTSWGMGGYRQQIEISRKV
ncbi:MAG: hypothetical protein SFU27_06470 [Thermonemataceae bacterium]|nr:hypothetical protein [Thermonemataceae bacterium]